MKLAPLSLKPVLALIGSSQLLEIAVNLGSAQRVLGANVGDEVIMGS